MNPLLERKSALLAKIQSEPNNPTWHHELGQTERMLGNFAGAEAHYRHALSLEPGYSFSQLALGQLTMQQSHFHEGRALFENRFRNATEVHWREFPAARWRGKSISGKRVFLWAEQGIGDILMYAGFFPHLLAQKPAQLTAGVPEKMLTLLQRSFPAIAFEPLQEKYENHTGFDFHAPMGDLLVHCLPSYIPSREHGPCIVPDPARLTMAREALSRLPGRKIGISWFTTNDYTGIIRNVPLPVWEPVLSTPGCHFFSLQHKVTPAGIDRRILVDPQFDPFRDIENLAALVGALDEIITVQNANIHFAGAIGTPSILLLSRGGDFRWPEGESNPWYHNITIERQEEPLVWEPVMRRVAAALQSRGQAHRSAQSSAEGRP